MPRRPVRTPDLADLLPSWELSLRAERKSPQTIKTYTDGAHRYLAWCAQNDLPATLDRTQVQAFVADLLDRGAQPATARSRHLAVRRYAAWLAEEGEIDTDPLVGIRPPKLDTKVVDPLTDDQLKALIAACHGTDMRDRRDEALVRLMAETGARAGEVLAMQLTDVTLAQGSAVV